MQQQQQTEAQEPQQQAPAANTQRSPFDVVEALAWLDLARVYPSDQFPTDRRELAHLILSYVQARTDLLKARATTRTLTAQINMMTNEFTTFNEELARLRLDNAVMRAALPADWEPARVRNEREHGAKLNTDATPPQDVANALPQIKPTAEISAEPADDLPI